MPTRYHIWDEKVLDEATSFTLRLTIPAHIYPVKNADGTDPVVSLDVEASTVRFALAALGQLHEQNRIYDIVVSKLNLDLDPETASNEEVEAAVAKLEEIDPHWIEFAFDATGEGDAQVTMRLRAPSGGIAINAFQALTSNEKLNGLLATFMPEDDEDA